MRSLARDCGSWWSSPSFANLCPPLPRPPPPPPPPLSLAQNTVSEADRDAFTAVLSSLDSVTWRADAPGRGRWVAFDGSVYEEVVYKANETLTYTAWRTVMPSGKTKYLTRTLMEGACPAMMNDFYNDDAHRLTW